MANHQIEQLKEDIQSKKADFERERELKKELRMREIEQFRANNRIPVSSTANQEPLAPSSLKDWTSYTYRAAGTSPKKTKIHQLVKVYIYAVQNNQDSANALLSELEVEAKMWTPNSKQAVSEALTCLHDLVTSQVQHGLLTKRIGRARGVLLQMIDSDHCRTSAFYRRVLAWIRHNPDKYPALPLNLIKTAALVSLNKTHQRKMDQTMVNQHGFTKRVFKAYTQAIRNEHLTKKAFEKCQVITRWCYERASKPPKLNVAVLRTLELNDVIKATMVNRGDMERFMTRRANNEPRVAGNIFDELFG